MGLKLSDTRVYEPQIRAHLGTTAHFCKVVVLKFIPLATALKQRWDNRLFRVADGCPDVWTNVDHTKKKKKMPNADTGTTPSTFTIISSAHFWRGGDLPAG